jgi:hypothetical protein
VNLFDVFVINVFAKVLWDVNFILMTRVFDGDFALFGFIRIAHMWIALVKLVLKPFKGTFDNKRQYHRGKYPEKQIESKYDQ